MSDTVEIDRTADTTTIEVPQTPPEVSKIIAEDLSPSAQTSIEVPQTPPEISEIIAEDLSPIAQTYDDFDTAQTPEWIKQFGTILAELPTYLGQFYQNNKGAVVTLGLIFAVIVTFKLTLAVLAAINGIPLLAPTFKLIGIAYTAWFVSRYLLNASTRSELSGEINSLKSEILGSYDQN